MYGHGERTFLVANGRNKTACVDPTSGDVLWTVPGGGWSTPCVVGDQMAVATRDKKLGLAAYKLSGAGATRLWNRPYFERGSSPVIYRGTVYAVKGSPHVFSGRPQARLLCVDLATGRLNWEVDLPATEISSPIVADGKILVEVNKHLYMWAADAKRHRLLARADLGIAVCTSPTLVDGILYLRHERHIAAYDLRR